MVHGANAGSSRSVPVPLRRARRRRSDAERNRARVLEVARRLVRERGIGAVTMDLLAGKANVGKGTLYRAFGSRAGLAEALVDEAERALQDAILTGPAPLGWGAAPKARLQAFVSAYLDLLAANADLLIETERGAPGARFHTGAYAFWHAHVSALLRQSAGSDPVVQAHTVLALLTADLYRHLSLEGVAPSRIQNAIQSMLDRSDTTGRRVRDRTEPPST